MSGHVTEQLNAYIDQELDETESFRVSQHLKVCEACRKEEQNLVEITGWITETYRIEPIPDFIDQKIMDEIKNLEKESRKLEYGIGAVTLSILIFFGFVHAFFNESWKIIYAVYRVLYSFVQALPQLVGVSSTVTISVVGGGLLIVMLTLPILWKLLHSIAVDERRGWQ